MNNHFLRLQLVFETDGDTEKFLQKYYAWAEDHRLKPNSKTTATKYAADQEFTSHERWFLMHLLDNHMGE